MDLMVGLRSADPQSRIRIQHELRHRDEFVKEILNKIDTIRAEAQKNPSPEADYTAEWLYQWRKNKGHF